MFNGTLLANVGFDSKSANELIASGDADLVSFARHYIANPDLPGRFSQNAPLAEGDLATYYQGGAAGFTSYPPYKERKEAVTSR
jgi:N-ethylmaleimide reductase